VGVPFETHSQIKASGDSMKILVRKSTSFVEQQQIAR